MIERLIGTIPDWMHPKHPVLRYQIRDVPNRRTLSAMLVYIALAVFLIGVMLFMGYAIATAFFSTPLQQDISQRAMNVLYYPTAFLQFLLSLLVLTLTVGVVGEERRHQTWDSLRVTASGVRLFLYAQLVTVFYRLSLFIVIILGIRLVFIGLMLYDITAHKGEYLWLLLANIEPQIPATLGGIPFAEPLGIILLALFLTAVTLLPITTMFFDTTVGLFIATRIKRRSNGIIAQLLLYLLRAVLMIALIYVGRSILNNDSVLPNGLHDSLYWLATLTYAAFGDWGLRLLHLGSAQQIWLAVPYGVMIGAFLLVVVILQILGGQWILQRAVLRSEHDD